METKHSPEFQSHAGGTEHGEIALGEPKASTLGFGENNYTQGATPFPVMLLVWSAKIH